MHFCQWADSASTTKEVLVRKDNLNGLFNLVSELSGSNCDCGGDTHPDQFLYNNRDKLTDLTVLALSNRNFH